MVGSLSSMLINLPGSGQFPRWLVLNLLAISLHTSQLATSHPASNLILTLKAFCIHPPCYFQEVSSGQSPRRKHGT